MSLLRRSLAAILLLAPATLLLQTPRADAGVFISVNIAPPALPVYTQPLCPAEGYIWTPGYWAWSDDGYYWVPGVWVQPPAVGLLWTPGYWGWGEGAYLFHPGYWGPHVGFYGGINYGFGYGGVGYEGGYWNHGAFAYNRAVNNINVNNAHNVYNRTVIVNNYNRLAFNGGNGGVQARPTPQEQAALREQHLPPTIHQQAHIQNAATERSQFARYNGGRPQTLAQPRIGERGLNQPGINQAARQPERGGYNQQPQRQNSVNRPGDNTRSNYQQNQQPNYQQQNRQQNAPQTQQQMQQQNRELQSYSQAPQNRGAARESVQPVRPAPRESAPKPRGGENHDEHPHR